MIDRDDTQIRAFRSQVEEHVGQPMIDVRSPGEYSGEMLHDGSWTEWGNSVRVPIKRGETP